MMVAEVYDAFLAAGMPEDKAVRAAQAMANLDSRFSKVEVDTDHRFARMQTDIDRRFDEVDKRFNKLELDINNRFNKVDLRFGKVEADLKLLKWMVGLVVAGIVALITKSLF